MGNTGRRISCNHSTYLDVCLLIYPPSFIRLSPSFHSKNVLTSVNVMVSYLTMLIAKFVRRQEKGPAGIGGHEHRFGGAARQSARAREETEELRQGARYQGRTIYGNN